MAYPLEICTEAIENDPLANDLPIEDGDFTEQTVRLPESISINIPVLSHYHPYKTIEKKHSRPIEPPLVYRSAH